MTLGTIITVLELGLITGLTVLSLFLSYMMLNVCDLSTDGCVTLGAAVAVVATLAGHPYLAIPLAMLAGVISGFVVAFLQTYMNINSLLAGIVVNTGLYSINIAIMGGASQLNMNKSDSIFVASKNLFVNVFGEESQMIAYSRLFVILLFVAFAIILLNIFLKTHLGLSIRATGNNPVMVKNSSINTKVVTIIALCVSNSLTALSGCLLAQMQKSVNIDIGTGMVTVVLASLLIGNLFMQKGNMALRLIFAVVGAIVFRAVYMVALSLQMPAYMLKLISSIIVIVAIATPEMKNILPHIKRRTPNA